MRHLLRVLVAVTTFLTVLSPAAAAGRDASTDLQTVERLMYATPMPDFVADAIRGDGWLDTSTDFCSAPLVGTTGRSFDFHDACRRHDFGYRNLRLLDRRYSPAVHVYWTASSRKRADDRFRADMRAHCASRPWYDEPTCYAWSETFYRAVRVTGGP